MPLVLYFSKATTFEFFKDNEINKVDKPYAFPIINMFFGFKVKSIGYIINISSLVIPPEVHISCFVLRHNCLFF